MLNKIKISAVAYTNTKPFIYGIEHSPVRELVELSLDVPADCADKLIENQVDIGLIPVAMIPRVPQAQIVGSYVIGSVGAVNSVFIFSEVPVTDIRTLRLDPQSRTSNMLARILLHRHFGVYPQWVSNSSEEADAQVLIGDRTFGRQQAYPYAYDLGEVWYQFTGLPFVYAAWVANKSIPQEFLSKFNEALSWGLAHRKEVIASLPPVPGFDLEDYLLHKLDFEFTAEKQQALTLFLEHIRHLEEESPELALKA